MEPILIVVVVVGFYRHYYFFFFSNNFFFFYHNLLLLSYVGFSHELDPFVRTGQDMGQGRVDGRRLPGRIHGNVSFGENDRGRQGATRGDDRVGCHKGCSTG